MDLFELRQKDHLSASSINSYVECGLQFKFSRVDKFKPDYEADALLFGSAIHKAIADFQQHRVWGETMPVDNIQTCFEAYWRKSAEDNPRVNYKKGKDFSILLNEGKGLLKVYAESQADNKYTVLAIEHPFVLEIEGLGVPIIGAIDMIEEDEQGTIIITDHKTASKAYSIADADNNFQMTVYQIAARQNGFTDREILLKLDCLIKTRTPKFEPVYTTRSMETEQRAIRKIQQVWDGIKKEVFIPNEGSWKCPYCSYKSYCNDWFSQ